MPTLAPPGPAATRPRKKSGITPDSTLGLLAKIVLLGLVDAFAVYVSITLFLQEKWVILVFASAVTLLINWIYLRKGGLPAKYLAPGIFFLVIFQVFVMVYSGYVAFTNYGDGHNSTKADAVNAIQLSAQQRVLDSPAYRVSILERDGDFHLLATDPDGGVSVGATDAPLEDADAITDATGRAVELEGYRTLQFGEVLANQEDILAVTVPFSDDPEDGSLRTSDGSSAYVYRPSLSFDEATSTFTDLETGTTYTDTGEGSFQSADGEQLSTGWKVNVGFDNFTKAFSDQNIRDPLLQVVLWTFTFAIVSVLSTFALGLFLANAFNLPDLRGKRIYRILMILPYAFPAFLAGLVWSGLLNPEFGFVNTTFFGGADIPWLTDPLLAKVSVLVVNLWLGFPYMFLVCTGALQSLPEEVNEAARMDGASAWRTFTAIKLPLLLVSVAPLLIASFAFNFNNFNVIYMLTDGGPRFDNTTANIGHTDILITMVYEIAFGTGVGRDYGLASALSIIIFLIVAVVSAVSFRQTKALEDIN
ncbi:ABC transporter permease subunit [Arthrobacter sp. Br18]|uniref:ABC transporter permease subunit n=1 Tax=Arthrobacter sp. Br18 TaxID=1312954 RepID=UPI00047A4B69|nr:ABC transporter permease subunit [Arthrobacter sp. Br18]